MSAIQPSIFAPPAAFPLETCLVAVSRSHAIVDPLIRAWHRTHPDPPVQFRIAFLVSAPSCAPLAVATFGRPIARYEDQYSTLELTRYAIGPDAPPNLGTWALARMRARIRIHMPDIVRLITYHDADEHTGSLYAADNWICVSETTAAPGSWLSRPNRRHAKVSHRVKWERQP